MTADPNACDYCERHPGVCHLDWHPTKGQLLEIGKEMSRRAQARERDEIRRMDDETLIAYGQRLRRMTLMADTDGLPDFLVELAQDWLKDAEREIRWRQLAQGLGGDPVPRASSWTARVEAVKSLADLGALIVNECGRARAMPGGRWMCRCPFHDDGTASLSVDPIRNLWHCFGCQDGGDAITYIQRRDGVEFHKAVAALEQWIGIEPPKRKPPIQRKEGRRPLGAILPAD